MAQVKKRKRYVVIVQGNGQTLQTVIVAQDRKGMYKVVNKHYGHLLKDEKGNEVGTITFEETELA